MTENRSVDGSIPPLATINRFTFTDLERRSFSASWVARWFRVLLLAEQFDVSFGLCRRLVSVLAELGDAFVSARRLYVDNEARFIGGAKERLSVGICMP